MMLALPLVSARHITLLISLLNHLSDADLYKKKISFIPIIYLFILFLITILSYTLILPVSQLKTEQLMTSQIRSHIYRAFNTNKQCSFAYSVFKIDEKSNLADICNTI